MSNYAIEEIEDMKKEVLSLKQELKATREELNKARLALAKIYEIVDEVYYWDKGWAVGDLYTDKVEEIGKTLQEYFEDDKINNTK